MSVLLFSTILAAPAAAQSIPRYDVPAYCQQVADVSGGSSMIYNGCIKMEQEAYDRMKASWSGVPARTRSYCDEVGQVSGGSHSILKGCVEMEFNAAANTQEFKY
ncbi:hypothetical protein [Mesorhizobium sp.]|uniref:hypothetical protein n=1 Tax=Mesorhizobium sp. TaxID=1871066 RepID=UPI000FE493E2|nr:hypothetical protein [Mesorhizobium sp.]RWD28733.1 MAG: hypothetical protein EOS34_29580 [Mesorhizobium sp.]RWE98632.1 MAG: hypothetical protein EOS43_17310 [Mesorhizobium sp.]